jgi:pyruvate dehydrogenase E1 component
MAANLQNAPKDLARSHRRDLQILESLQNRVLWLSTQIVHYANNVRDNPDGLKVGGHQASSASIVSLMTALYFHELRRGDFVAVKPHASPVFHAIQFLLGDLPPEKLTELRAYQGLQAYPSRTKDVDPVDFSTGSVGLGAVAPNFAALTSRYLKDQFGTSGSHRFIALIGDAELDEGNVWEALGEGNLRALDQVIWIVDLNRQSLDRVVPSGKAQKIEEMFHVHDWQVIEVKYGRRLQAYFERPGGERLRERIDLMTNDEYQSLLRISDGNSIRDHLTQSNGSVDHELLRLLEDCPAGEIRDLLADLGGHDLDMILDAYEEADRVRDRPVVIIAYTIKGWGLPIAGDLLNHSKLLTTAQMDELRMELGVPRGREFASFAPGTEEANYIDSFKAGISSDRKWPVPSGLRPSEIPATLGSTHKGKRSTQQVLGSLLTSLTRRPEIAARIVTTSPDVASSTNLGGWINKMGVYSSQARINYFKEAQIPQLLNWEQSPKGQHIELGISENDFFLLLTVLGLSAEFFGETLLPIGTIYDTFISRGLDALNYGLYCKSKFIFVGSPSGISLSREGGAHQSVITPSIGAELPNLVYYEPCFGQELEWILLASLRNLLDREHGTSVYLRLSTVPIDQALFPPDADGTKEAEFRRGVLRGGYRLVDHAGHSDYRPGKNVASIFACGVMVPEALEASRELGQRGILANVINMTGPGLLYRGWRHTTHLRAKNPRVRCTSLLEHLIPEAERACPIVTVIDGHSHTLSFLGAVFGTRTVSLGVDEFGQTGSRQELYEHYGISRSAIVEAVESVLTSDGRP